ncbi:MAG TPA: SAM-dependent chlorinase/fluorinase [Terriglobales bacterium]|nr:SAM-dependent chlorinase/fluorinase [Terriglobales bacterium]
MAPLQRIVTLTTDFGITEHYVGAMKGAIYNINPAAQVVDICNSVHSYDLLDGALTLAQAYSYYPPNTLHVVVVDPGVGTARRPILANVGKYLFLAPDNGILSLVYEREEAISVRHVTSQHYFLQPVSNTFHGRDVFAPVAGWLSKGVDPEKFGEVVTDFVRFTAPKPKSAGDNLFKGIVLKVDKFGNLVTNITPQDLPQLFTPQPPPFKISVGKTEISKMKTTYAEGAPGEVFAVLGSMGFLEIVTNRGSAQNTIGAGKGTEVGVKLEG